MSRCVPFPLDKLSRNLKDPTASLTKASRLDKDEEERRSRKKKKRKHRDKEGKGSEEANGTGEERKKRKHRDRENETPEEREARRKRKEEKRQRKEARRLREKQALAEGGKNGRAKNGEVGHGPDVARPSSSLDLKGPPLASAAPKPRENGRALSDQGAQRSARQDGASPGMGGAAGAGVGRAGSEGGPSRSQGSVGQGRVGGGKGSTDERQRQKGVKEELSRRAASGHTATTGSGGSGSGHALSLSSRRAPPRQEEHEAEVMSPRREDGGGGGRGATASVEGAASAEARAERGARRVRERLQRMMHGVLDQVEMCLPEDKDRSLQWLMGDTPGLDSGPPDGPGAASTLGGSQGRASVEEGRQEQGQGQWQGQSQNKGAEEQASRHRWSEARYLPEFDIHLLPFVAL